MEHGKFDIDRIPFDIMSSLKKACQIEMQIVKGRGIKLYKKVIGAIPASVYGDSQRFTQIILNLMSNSVKFTKKGYVAIIVRWARDMKEVNQFSLEKIVSDTLEEPIKSPDGVTKEGKIALYSERK